MAIKNRYIFVESPFESALVQSLLFEAGASWPIIGEKTISLKNCIIVIDDSLEMHTMVSKPLSKYKKLDLHDLVEIVKRDVSEVDNSYHVCKFSDNHISFEDSEVEFTIDELTELLPVICALSHRDFEITTSDETDDQVFSLTNLTINFK